jgi:alpha-1,3-glucosyltransferase
MCVTKQLLPAVFFPAAYLASSVFSTAGGPDKRKQAAASDVQRQLFVLAAMLLQPALVLTDHGHFQYNCISLGLSALAATVIASGHDILGSILFSLSLNHKQMGLFFAPAFFAHLLGKCLQRPTVSQKVCHAMPQVIIRRQDEVQHAAYHSSHYTFL